MHRNTHTNTNMCNNCGKQGHMFHQCKLPITSYGIIAFRNSSVGMQFLMIRRKDSFGYIDFVRGKYSPYNILQVRSIIDEMSVEEKERINLVPFESLWKDMWGSANSNQYTNEETSSRKKYDLLKQGFVIDGVTFTLNQLVTESQTSWKETEWEFPKGRRNPKEKDLDCALREFEEETGISKHTITVVENMLPFVEIFIGSNHKPYKHKYFIAAMDEEISSQNTLSGFQVSEVSKLEWKTATECLESIRPYNLEKKEVIENINKVLQEYRLYS
jgi:8-oxo-dGTP pyrophosphatase MutT (NUDIX family)